MKTRMILMRTGLLMALVALLAAGSVSASPPAQGPGATDEIAVAGNVASRIVYQGRLTDAGGNPLNGSYNLVFQLWNDATAGSQVGSNITKNAVPVSGGMFTVELDVNQNVFNGQALWLLVQVNGQNLSPRQALLPVPYALSLIPGSVISNGANRVTLGASSSGAFGYSTGACDAGVWGESNYTGPTNIACTGGAPWRAGGYFTGAGNTTTGVYGYAKATTGATQGVYGKADSTSGSGVYGYAPAATGSPKGVFGKAVSPTGVGVGGEATGLSGVGVRAWARGDYGEAFHGEATGPYGLGGVFISEGYYGRGISAKGNQAAADLQGKVLVRSYTTGGLVMELGEGLDYSEGFDVSGDVEVAPGTVLVIDPGHPGQLKVSGQPYDTKVAGIVSGANGLGSAIRVASEQFDRDVALAGRVYCNVDATETAVEPGDLLTTSATPGYAMKVVDYARAQGAILGKAMEPLAKGQTGQILVLVTLQ